MSASAYLVNDLPLDVNNNNIIQKCVPISIMIRGCGGGGMENVRTRFKKLHNKRAAFRNKKTKKNKSSHHCDQKNCRRYMGKTPWQHIESVHFPGNVPYHLLKRAADANGNIRSAVHAIAILSYKLIIGTDNRISTITIINHRLSTARIEINIFCLIFRAKYFPIKSVAVAENPQVPVHRVRHYLIATSLSLYIYIYTNIGGGEMPKIDFFQYYFQIYIYIVLT